MGTTHPIKDKDDLEALKNFYLYQERNLRNYALINTGLNTALRVSDLLSLRWNDAYNFTRHRFRRHLILSEQKTGKEACIAINQSVQEALSLYLTSVPRAKPQDYIFVGRRFGTHLSRSQAFRIIKHASFALNLSEHISCHSLRKTFGYQAWASGANATVLTVLFNHSSFQITRRYLGIEQDDKDKVYLNLNL